MLELGSQQFNQIAAAAGVTPLVVVPGQDFHAAIADDFGVLRVHYGGIRIALEVGGDELFFGISKLAFEFGDDEVERFGRTRRTGNHVDRGGTSAAQILVREVEKLLIVSVGMDGGHGAAMDSKRFVKDFGDGGETVCGAGGVRNDMVLRWIVGFVVHAEDEGGIRAVGGRRDDDFFHRGAKVLLRINALGEKTGGLDDDIRADGGPVNLSRIFRLENLEALPFHGDSVFGVRDGVWKIAEDGVVLQKVRERLGIGDVIDGHELNVLVIERGAHDVASDAAEAVDADLNGHYFLR